MMRIAAWALVAAAVLAGCERWTGEDGDKPTWYVNPAAGSDDADGSSAETAFAHAPGDPEAASVAAAQPLHTGDTVLFTVDDPDAAPWSGQRPPRWERRIHVFQCVDPACGYQMRLTNKEAAEAFERLPAGRRRGMIPPRWRCEHCGAPACTCVKAMQCPKCGFWFASPKVVAQARRKLGTPAKPHVGPVLCPNCGVDVDLFWRTHKTQHE